MPATDTRGTLRTIPRDECLALLAAADIGRLALVEGRQPVILPVNFVLDGDVIVFRTDPGLKLSAGPGHLVAFEVDAFDRERREGWSVVVAGRLEEATPYDEPEQVARTAALTITPWAAGEKAHRMRIVPRRITGRRVAHDGTGA